MAFYIVWIQQVVTRIATRLLYDRKNKLFVFVSLALCMIAQYFCHPTGGFTMFYSAVVVIFMVWVFISSSLRERTELNISKLFITKMFIWVASISFPLYLIHEYVVFPCFIVLI